MARLTSSPENPIPVRVVAQKIGAWIARLGEIWVDGQIAQLTRRPGVATQFLTLRDSDSTISLTVTCGRGVLPDTVEEGSRVVVHARPDFYLERGVFSLPFLPRRVGIITGRASAAEHDVVENARRRLPAVRFRIENAATQGPAAVAEVVAALERLDRDPEVDVIVITRGGGSVEDLLPFSNETLLRAVAASRTPVVSAIGHESDTPLLDLVADVAASTPTDAGKRVVPDLADELARVRDLRDRARASVRRRVQAEADAIASVPDRLRTAMRTYLRQAQSDTSMQRDRIRRHVSGRLAAAIADLEHVKARVRALSPQSTLDRGYAVVRTASGLVVRDPVEALGPLRIRVARGEFGAIAENA
jgi:exodeoxyribonuclease VII large subunit